MEVAKVTSKGQITIPISIRRKLGINEGDKVLFMYKTDGVMMVNPNTYKGEPADEIVAAEAAPADVVIVAKPLVPVAAAEIKEEAAAAEAAAATDIAHEKPTRPILPPIDEPPKPDTHIGGFNLSTLLDDIRSIGSNI
jgi:AbrB family looped-hinge helix DNA binding protein